MSDRIRPPIEQIENGQPITLSDVIPVAALNNNTCPIVFKSAFANSCPTLLGNLTAKPAGAILGPQLAKRHWSIESTEDWVVRPSKPVTPATW